MMNVGLVEKVSPDSPGKQLEDEEKYTNHSCFCAGNGGKCFLWF